MALRVLLADESSTIKKVFQLALQDYAVYVKSINVGTDVESIASAFKPDIIFADVLLQKLDGYDVCKLLRESSAFTQTPVVLMWSGFMDFDEERFLRSKADDRLEKPFDVETLRSLIKRHVPKTHSQNLSEYLSFPNTKDLEKKMAQPPASATAHSEEPQELVTESQYISNQPHQAAQEPEPTFSPPNDFQDEDLNSGFSNPNEQSLNSAKNHHEDLNLEPLDASSSKPTQDDDFHSVSLNHLQNNSQVHNTSSPQKDEDSQWVSQDLSEFQLGDHIELEDSPAIEYNSTPDDFNPSLELDVEDLDKASQEPKQDTTPEQPAISSGLSQQQIEQIVRDQVKQSVEKVVWQVVPEMAKQIIEKELKKLLEDENELR